MSSVFAPKLRAGDVVKDYEQYGPITQIYRKGAQWIAATQSGTELAFLPHERPKLVNR